MQKTWKPTVAGILEIVAGCGDIIFAIILIIGIIVTSGAFDIPGTEEIPDFVPWVVALIAMIAAAVGSLALIGGIYAIQRKKWGLALAGSIATLIGSTVIGVLALIFTSLARDDFES